MIRRWLRLRDRADDLDGRMYRLGCEIERTNIEIEEQQRRDEERERRRAARNGKVLPPERSNG
jgi:hypothetical protein